MVRSRRDAGFRWRAGIHFSTRAADSYHSQVCRTRRRLGEFGWFSSWDITLPSHFPVCSSEKLLSKNRSKMGKAGLTEHSFFLYLADRPSWQTTKWWDCLINLWKAWFQIQRGNSGCLTGPAKGTLFNRCGCIRNLNPSILWLPGPFS